VILNAKRSSHWLEGAVFSPARVRWKVREVEAGRGSMRWRSTACFVFDWRAVSWRWRRRSPDVYQSACRRGIFVCFYSFFTLSVYILFFVFFLFFCYCCYSVYHTVPLQSVFLKSCTFLGHIGMQGICMAYCYRCSLVCLSVSAGYNREPCKNG